MCSHLHARCSYLLSLVSTPAVFLSCVFQRCTCPTVLAVARAPRRDVRTCTLRIEQGSSVSYLLLSLLEYKICFIICMCHSLHGAGTSMAVVLLPCMPTTSFHISPLGSIFDRVPGSAVRSFAATQDRVGWNLADVALIERSSRHDAVAAQQLQQHVYGHRPPTGATPRSDCRSRQQSHMRWGPADEPGRVREVDCNRRSASTSKASQHRSVRSCYDSALPSSGP